MAAGGRPSAARLRGRLGSHPRLRQAAAARVHVCCLSPGCMSMAVWLWGTAGQGAQGQGTAYGREARQGDRSESDPRARLALGCAPQQAHRRALRKAAPGRLTKRGQRVGLPVQPLEEAAARAAAAADPGDGPRVRGTTVLRLGARAWWRRIAAECEFWCWRLLHAESYACAHKISAGACRASQGPLPYKCHLIQPAGADGSVAMA